MIYFFNHENIQHMSAILPIYDYMKKHGYDVSMPPKPFWGKKGGINIDSTFGGQYNIFVPHGPGKENTDYIRRTAPDCFGVLVPGPIGYEVCEKIPYIDMTGHECKETPNLSRIKIVGWPKSDLIFSPEREKIKQEIKDLLKLPYEKTVLLADHRDVDYLTKITERLKLNLVIKPAAGAQYNITKAPHIRWIDPLTWNDITQLFLISDLCIVNPSTSVGTEFIVTGRPVLTNERGLKPDSSKKLSGFLFKEEEYPFLTGGLKKIEENIKRSLDDPDELKAQRERWVKRIIYKPDGHASERAAKAIMELVG